MLVVLHSFFTLFSNALYAENIIDSNTTSISNDSNEQINESITNLSLFIDTCSCDQRKSILNQLLNIKERLPKDSMSLLKMPLSKYKHLSDSCVVSKTMASLSPFNEDIYKSNSIWDTKLQMVRGELQFSRDVIIVSFTENNSNGEMRFLRSDSLLFQLTFTSVGKTYKEMIQYVKSILGNSSTKPPASSGISGWESWKNNEQTVMVSSLADKGTIVTFTNNQRKPKEVKNLSTPIKKSKDEWKADLFKALKTYNNSIIEQQKACEEFNPYDVSSLEARNNSTRRVKLWQEAYQNHGNAIHVLNIAARHVGHNVVYQWAMENKMLFYFVDIDRFTIIEPMEVNCGKF
jgi:hypothetical protein